MHISSHEHPDLVTPHRPTQEESAVTEVCDMPDAVFDTVEVFDTVATSVDGEEFVASAYNRVS